MIRLGNAPVSYGVFGTTIAGASPRALLTSIAQAGYEGTELGPPGFFGDPAETAQALAEAGLAAVGSYVPIHFSLAEHIVEEDMDRMRQTCAELVACGGGLAILADEGSEELLLNPARPWNDRSLALDDDNWRLAATRVQAAVRLAREFGLDCAFHPHISTYVESPWEVERLLETTDVDLTLDIGHIQLAGGDPRECLRAWRDRVRHVHIKDVELRVLEQAKADQRTDFDEWWAGVCTPLGSGDVDVDGFISDLVGSGYDGWLVVEQDRRPTAPHEYSAVAQQQAENRQWLSEIVVRHAGGDA